MAKKNEKETTRKAATVKGANQSRAEGTGADEALKA